LARKDVGHGGVVFGARARSEVEFGGVVFGELEDGFFAEADVAVLEGFFVSADLGLLG
jgi:hypothetical protein